MIKEELAALLDGTEYPVSLSREVIAQAKAAGLVIVYGASDDLMEFDGAISDEFGCYEGGTAFVDREGLIPSWDNVQGTYDESEAEEYFKRKLGGRSVEAIWDAEGFSWIYKTDLPHATFVVMEDGETYCRGIVFSLADLAAVDPGAEARLQAGEALAVAVGDYNVARSVWTTERIACGGDPDNPSALFAWNACQAAFDRMAEAYAKFQALYPS